MQIYYMYVSYTPKICIEVYLMDRDISIYPVHIYIYIYASKIYTGIHTLS